MKVQSSHSVMFHFFTQSLVDWASLSSHTSWSRDEDTLSSISLTSVRSFDLPATHSLVDGPQSVRQYNHPTIIRDGKMYSVLY